MTVNTDDGPHSTASCTTTQGKASTPIAHSSGVRVQQLAVALIPSQKLVLDDRELSDDEALSSNCSAPTSAVFGSYSSSSFQEETSDGESSIDSVDSSKERDYTNQILRAATDRIDDQTDSKNEASFMALRATYLLVTLVIMLADGLQGTHLYVLYESYGFSVASLYCLGFFTGGIVSPVTGPLIDKIGRKKAAMLYCALEVFINMLEQYPFLWGLVVSRMIGGLTTNLLSQVFETWLDTEYRRRGFAKERYELIMRDSVIVSNMAAICSGYLAHVLAELYGPVGPFRGAVSCTSIALVVVALVWTENYGTDGRENKNGEIGCCSERSMGQFLAEAITALRQDTKMLRVGILQGLSAGSLQIFVFAWTPALRYFALKSSGKGAWGLDKNGEPAYGLIFGAYMAAGVLGGLSAPRIRKFVTQWVSPVEGHRSSITIELEGEGQVPVRPMAVEVLASSCYIVCACLLLLPCIVSEDSSSGFSTLLMAFVAYEFLMGVFLPCEGVIRSLYFPANARASIMTLPRLVVNFAVAGGVMSTEFFSLRTTFAIVSILLVVAALLQLSLVSSCEWSSLSLHAGELRRQMSEPARRLQRRMSERARRHSFTASNALSISKTVGRLSLQVVSAEKPCEKAKSD